MSAPTRKSTLWHFLHAPVYLYRWRLGWLLGRRFILLTHIGRSSGQLYQTVLEVVEYRKQGPEVLVVSGFGRDAGWVRNIEARGGEEVEVGSQRFLARHRFLDEDEAMKVIEDYEQRNRFMSPILHAALSYLLGWPYRGSGGDRRKLVKQLPLIAFRPA